jgi:hypothetical protein
MSDTLTITISLTGDAFAEQPAEEVYRILSDYAGLVGFLSSIEERTLLDINGNTVGHARLTSEDPS